MLFHINMDCYTFYWITDFEISLMTYLLGVNQSIVSHKKLSMLAFINLLFPLLILLLHFLFPFSFLLLSSLSFSFFVLLLAIHLFSQFLPQNMLELCLQLYNLFDIRGKYSKFVIGFVFSLVSTHFLVPWKLLLAFEYLFYLFLVPLLVSP